MGTVIQYKLYTKEKNQTILFVFKGALSNMVFVLYWPIWLSWTYTDT